MWALLWLLFTTLLLLLLLLLHRRFARVPHRNLVDCGRSVAATTHLVRCRVTSQPFRPQYLIVEQASPPVLIKLVERFDTLFADLRRVVLLQG
uniref:Putative secreted protein n=1 Tax=Anopheles darlingi TaxID=43151 RepID=A0A2M4D794_ANODA